MGSSLLLWLAAIRTISTIALCGWGAAILFKKSNHDCWVNDAPFAFGLAIAFWAICAATLTIKTIVLLVLVFMLPYLSQIVRSNLDVLEGGNLQRGASAGDIERIPVRNFQPGMFHDESALCAICQQLYRTNEELRFLQCHPSHHFHRECLETWLAHRDSCPLCRRSIASLPPQQLATLN